MTQIETADASNTIECEIHERGNGLPDVGDYVAGNDGNLYLVESMIGPIQAGRRPGAGNWILATVTLADWDDCGGDAEFPAEAIVRADEQTAEVES